MRDFVILAIGGGFGAMLAWLGSRKGVLSLPDFSKTTKLNGMPLSVGERQTREGLLRSLSLVGSPLLYVLYGLMSAFLALYLFGSGEWVH